MLTATSRTDDERRAEEAGADLFLTKPFSPLDLLRLVDQIGGAVSAYLGLGSNVGDRRREPDGRAPRRWVRSRMSSIYETAPQGEVLDQPDFLNAVVEIETDLGPEELLDECKRDRVRARPGRRAASGTARGRSTSTSCCWATCEYESERLRIPHRDLETRRFVLEPLKELAPERVDEARLAAVAGPARPASSIIARMLLAIDAGNTQTHIGMYKDEELAEHWRLHTDRDVTVDRIATELAGLLGPARAAAERHRRRDRLVGRARAEPRVRAALGALPRGPAADGGARPEDRDADPDGQPARGRRRPAGERARRLRADRHHVHRGGLRHRRQLRRRLVGRRVPRRRPCAGRRGVARRAQPSARRGSSRSTSRRRSPRSGAPPTPRSSPGIVYGFAGQVDGILGRIREELGEEATAVATGGHASIIAPHCDLIDEVDDLLTLTGLRLIWERNRP